MTLEASSPAARLTEALVGELASAMGGSIGVAATVEPASEGSDPEWTITVTIGGPAPGVVTLGVSRPDGVRLAQLATGGEGEPSDTVVAELLQELVGQAIGMLRLQPEAEGVLFCVEAPGQAASPGGTPHYYAFTLSPDFVPVVGVWQASDAPAAAPASPSPRVQQAARPENGAATARRLAVAPAGKVPANLDVILDIDLPLSVRFGQTHLTIEALTRLGPGSVLDLGRSPDDPVEVLVNGRLVAHAEVVVVSGHYGVRILEVVSAADRIRGLTG